MQVDDCILLFVLPRGVVLGNLLLRSWYILVIVVWCYLFNKCES